jgi:hypothetical protein
VRKTNPKEERKYLEDCEQFRKDLAAFRESLRGGE